MKIAGVIFIARQNAPAIAPVIVTAGQILQSSPQPLLNGW